MLLFACLRSRLLNRDGLDLGFAQLESGPYKTFNAYKAAMPQKEEAND